MLNAKMSLTSEEIDIAELSLLLLQHRALDELETQSKDFSDRQSAALGEARKRMLAKLNDQITFKQRLLSRKR